MTDPDDDDPLAGPDPYEGAAAGSGPDPYEDPAAGSASGPDPAADPSAGPDPYDLAVYAGLVRVLAFASWRVAARTADLSARAGTHMLRRAVEGDPPGRIVADVAAEVNGFVRDLLGLPPEEPDPTPAPVTREELRARGAELLRRSASLDDYDEGHPAYARILADLVPDEARILRFLAQNGPQPTLDIRTGRPFGIGSSQIAGGLNMLAEHAGLRHLTRTGPYLTNLSRLGLIEFSPDPVDDPARYQLLEAQPKVTEVLTQAGRAPRIIHHSIRLTDFGQDFCTICLPLD